MNQLIYIAIIIWTGFFLQERTPVDFHHKTICKELKKVSGITNPKRIELTSLTKTSPAGEISGKFYLIPPASPKTNSYFLYVGRVNSCRAGGCSNSNGTPVTDTQYEYFDYFILFSQNGKILKVKIFNYQATHGQEITARGWLNQFTGTTSIKKLKVGKNIDAISGATVSVYAITEDVSIQISRLAKLLKHKTGKKKPLFDNY